jgi:RNA polymerase sigma-70 factor (ECF subfamily)
MPATFQQEVADQLPHLRAYARGLARDRFWVDDLVQETAARALRFADKFEPGTNLKAWLVTILKNEYLNEIRRQKHVAQIDIETVESSLAIAGNQEHCLQLREMQEAFDRLAPARRDALMMVGVEGASYEEAARAAGCAVGTIKSRVSRARLELQHDLLRGPPGTASGADEDAEP